jgi:hypothetical protein
MTTKLETLTIKVAGGLGNQLFMFYGGRHLAEKLGKEPIFDTTALKPIKSLHPGLNVFDLGLLAGYQVSEKINMGTLASNLGELTDKIVRKIGIEYLSQVQMKKFVPKEIGYINPASIMKQVTSVEGYFQSWKYFSLAEDGPKLLSLLEGMSSPWFKETLQDLESERPLVIHVRRGDLRRAENRSLGVLSKEYFRKIMKLNPDRSVWIFSDSPSEALAEFNGIEAVSRIVHPPIDSDPIDSLLLMSKADVLGISNSTFSWWAGNLSGPNSLIYAPKKWFEERSDPIDLIPPNWHTIPSEWEKR